MIIPGNAVGRICVVDNLVGRLIFKMLSLVDATFNQSSAAAKHLYNAKSWRASRNVKKFDIFTITPGFEE